MGQDGYSFSSPEIEASFRSGIKLNPLMLARMKPCLSSFKFTFKVGLQTRNIFYL